MNFEECGSKTETQKERRKEVKRKKWKKKEIKYSNGVARQKRKRKVREEVERTLMGQEDKN